jgi:hypothetical protein
MPTIPETGPELFALLDEHGREQYRLLQAAVLIKMCKQDRLSELPEGPIDPTVWLSGNEALRIFRNAKRRERYALRL